MILLVPGSEDTQFPNEFKKVLLHHINILYREYSAIPDRIIFKGKLGKHLHNILLNNKWNLGITNILHVNGNNSIEIGFSKNITVSNKSNLSNHKSNIDGTIVNGWSGEAYSRAMSQISPDMNFNIEKTQTPKITILLKPLLNK